MESLGTLDPRRRIRILFPGTNKIGPAADRSYSVEEDVAEFSYSVEEDVAEFAKL